MRLQVDLARMKSDSLIGRLLLEMARACRRTVGIPTPADLRRHRCHGVEAATYPDGQSISRPWIN